MCHRMPQIPQMSTPLHAPFQKCSWKEKHISDLDDIVSKHNLLDCISTFGPRAHCSNVNKMSSGRSSWRQVQINNSVQEAPSFYDRRCLIIKAWPRFEWTAASHSGISPQNLILSTCVTCIYVFVLYIHAYVCIVYLCMLHWLVCEVRIVFGPLTNQ